MRLSSTSHSPSLLPSPPLIFLLRLLLLLLYVVRGLHSAKTAAASPSGLGRGWSFEVKGPTFPIVQLDSLAQASPHVSNSSSVPQLNTASAPYTPTLSLFLAHVSLTPCVWCSISSRMRVGCNPGDRLSIRRDAHARKT